MTLASKQFNKLATKDDLNSLVAKSEFDKKSDQILTAIDGLAKNVQDFQAELASNQIAHDRMRKHIESLEKRLIKIEFRTGIRRKK